MEEASCLLSWLSCPTLACENVLPLQVSASKNVYVSTDINHVWRVLHERILELFWY